MIDVYIYRPDETLVYHMQTALELAALIAAFRCMDGWDRIEAIMPQKTARLWTPRPVPRPPITPDQPPITPAVCGVFCVHGFCGWVGRASIPHRGPEWPRHATTAPRCTLPYQPTPQTPPRASIPRSVFTPHRPRPIPRPRPRAWEASPGGPGHQPPPA